MRTNKLNIMTYLVFSCILLLTVINVTGCNEELAPTENSSALLEIAGNDVSGPLNVGPSANGSAILSEEDLFGYFQNFSFQAKENWDGSITGSIEFKCRIPGSGRAHGTIDCLTIEGNEAILSGVITQTDKNLDFLPENVPFWFKVVDNGEGNNYPADEFSDIYVLHESIPCGESLPVPLFPIENGNVQVNP